VLEKGSRLQGERAQRAATKCFISILPAFDDGVDFDLTAITLFALAAKAKANADAQTSAVH